MMRGLVIALVALGTGCGGKSGDGPADASVPVEMPADYCEEFPEDNPYCGEDGLSLSEAWQKAEGPETMLPAGNVPMQIDVVDISPDGEQLGNAGRWTFWFWQREQEYLRVTVTRLGAAVDPFIVLGDCASDDWVSGNDLDLDVQRARVKLEQEVGFTFVPGTFQMNASVISGCLFEGGYDATLVNLPDGEGGGYTVEFSERFPDGIVCMLDAISGCTSQQ